MESDWADALGALSGAFSAVAALVAVGIAVWNQRRAAAITRAQMYLMLRQGFYEIFKELGELNEETPADNQEKLARAAYWHHAYDEWRVARMAPDDLADLWTQHFEAAVQSGYPHPALKTALADLMSHPEQGFAAYAKDFVDEFCSGLGDQTAGKDGGAPDQPGPC